jgi:hypothetical protein
LEEQLTSSLQGEGTVDRTLARLAGVSALGAPLLAAFYGVVRVAYEDYYAHLGLTPEAVGLGQAAIVSRVAVYGVLPALTVAIWLGFAAVTYRVTLRLHGLWANAEGWRDSASGVGLTISALLALVGVTVLSLRLFARGPGSRLVASVLPVVLGNAFLIAGIVAMTVSSEETRLRVRRFWRSHFAAAAPLYATCLAAALFVALAINFWSGADDAGRDVRATGELSRKRFGYLNVLASPARVVPKGADPLNVCDERTAVLVGRHAGTSFVLLLPPAGSTMPSEVLPLGEDDYAVATTSGPPRSCLL